jgi:hypothetical protein
MRQPSPTLVVGIGGTGANVIWQLRKLFFSKHGNINPHSCLQYLYVDLVDDQYRSWLDEESPAIALSSNEKLVLNLPALSLDIISDAIPWIADGPLVGTGSSRLVGRVIAIKNGDSIRSAITTQLKGLDSQIRNRDDRNGLNLIVVASLGGGTGSGMLLDIAAHLRILSPPRTKIIAYLVSSSFFDAQMSNSLLSNEHATLDDLQAVRKTKRYESMPYAVVGELFDEVFIVDNEAAPYGTDLNRNREEVFAATAGMVEANIGGSDLPAQVRRLYEYSEPSKLIGLRNDLVVVNEELLDYLRRHPELLYELHPRRFEEVIAAIWSSLGYEVTLTPRSRDGGKDLYAVQRTLAGDLLYIIECKRYSPDKPVGVEIVRGVYGVSQQERATMGVVATTSYFTKDAQQFQRMVKYQLSLTDYRDLTAWLNRLQK